MLATNNLKQLEAVIEKGLSVFYEVGNALWAIKEHQLYRDNYATFDAYCIHRWQMKSKRAYQLMSGAIVRDNLLYTGVNVLPSNEAQTRPLATLTDELQGIAWSIAVDASDELDIPLTQSVVKQAVKVVNEMMTTQAITVGSEQFSIKQLLRNQVMTEVVEAKARQSQHIKDNTHSKQVARYCAVWNGNSFEITDTSALTVGNMYQVLIYTVEVSKND